MNVNISHIRSVDTFHITAAKSLHWRHNDQDGVSNHQPHGCLLKRLFGRRSKKTPKLRVTGLCAWNSPGPVNSPHKGPVTRKMFPFDDVIMFFLNFFIVRQNKWSQHSMSVMTLAPRTRPSAPPRSHSKLNRVYTCWCATTCKMGTL